LALTACGASTKVVRANLDTPGLSALRDEVKGRCVGIPRAWPATAEATQADVEKLVKRDQAHTVACARASLRYVGRIEKRDKDLAKSIR
jgi:hypothetical protein